VSLVVDEHRQYLSDETRLDAFRRAIDEVVRPGAVVVDLGCGSGILGLLACRAGAARVYAIDEGGIIEVAREAARANGFADRITHVEGHSSRVTLPELADVLVADQIGRFGFEAGVIEYFADAQRRFLKPAAQTIPSALQLWIAPVEAPDAFSQIEFWKSRPGGFDFSGVHRIARNTGYPIRFEADQLLGEPVLGVEMNAADDRPVSFTRESVVTRDGVLHGIAGWFAARLSSGVCMTNAPRSPSRIARRNTFFPIARPVSVDEGSRVSVRMRILPTETVVAWDVAIIPPGVADSSLRFGHSTLEGMLVLPSDLARTRPTHRPVLTRWGLARRSVLELCDGDATVEEIERELLRRHPDLFPTLADAAVFAAEVITRYGA
jgi:hypothetical protein